MPMFASRGAYVGKPLHIGSDKIIGIDNPMQS